MEVKTVKTERNEADYISFGNGGKTMIIVPGLCIKSVILSGEAVKKQYGIFENDYTVYLFDNGKNYEKNLTVNDYAEDLASYMTELKLKDAYVFGVSMGGMISQCLCVNHPELVKKLFLSSTVSKMNKTLENTLKEWISFCENKDGEKFVDSFIEKVYSESFKEKYAPMIKLANSNITDEEFNKFVFAARACFGFGVYDDLCKIKCPVFAAGSEKDRVLTGEATSELANKLNCGYYIYTDFSHAVYDEDSEFILMLETFFRAGN